MPSDTEITNDVEILNVRKNFHLPDFTEITDKCHFGSKCNWFGPTSKSLQRVRLQKVLINCFRGKKY